MTKQLRKIEIEQAMQEDLWSFGNEILYRMCREFPDHSREEVVAAKIWLIGRSYAAAIERRKPSEPDGAFFQNKVVPLVMSSKIDDLLTSLEPHREVTWSTADKILTVHKYVTDLFGKISGMQKRSLASKYLHFHNPQLFFLFDGRACSGLNGLKPVLPKNFVLADCDGAYGKFVGGVLALRESIEKDFQIRLTPRQIDRLLLQRSM